MDHQEKGSTDRTENIKDNQYTHTHTHIYTYTQRDISSKIVFNPQHQLRQDTQVDTTPSSTIVYMLIIF